MAKYRGSQGNVTIAGAGIGNITSWEFTPARAALDATVLTDTAKKTGLDIPGGSGRVTALFDAADPAQEDILDILLTNTDTVALAAEFLTATGKKLVCSIVPTSAPITVQKGQYQQVSFSFETDGAITKTWA